MSEPAENMEQVAEPQTTETAEKYEHEWHSQISPDLLKQANIADFTDVDSLAKSYVNLSQLLGKEKIPVPGPFATDDELNHVYSKLGRPESSDGYELSMNHLSEGQEPNEDIVKGFKDASHKMGLAPRQAQGLLDWFNEMQGNQRQTMDQSIEQHRQDSEMELRKEWGASFDAKLKTAVGVVSQFGNQEIFENVILADGTQLGNSPEFAKLMANVGEYINNKIGEDKLEGTKTSNAVTVEDLQEQLAKITAPNSPYYQKHHVEHDRVVDEALNIREQLSQFE